MPIECTLRIAPDGTVTRPGYNEGSSTLTVASISRRYVVVKATGTHYWSSRGRQGYNATRFTTYAIKAATVSKDLVTLLCEELIGAELRGKPVGYDRVRSESTVIASLARQESQQRPQCRRCGEPASPAAWHNGYCDVCADQITNEEREGK